MLMQASAKVERAGDKVCYVGMLAAFRKLNEAAVMPAFRLTRH